MSPLSSRRDTKPHKSEPTWYKGRMHRQRKAISRQNATTSSSLSPNFRDEFLDDLDALGTLFVDEVVDWDRVDVSDLDADGALGLATPSDDDAKMPASTNVGRATRPKPSARVSSTTNTNDCQSIATRRHSGKTLAHLQQFRLLVAEAKERDVKAREEALRASRSALRKRKRDLDDRDWEQTVKERVLNRHEQDLKDREAILAVENDRLLEKEARLKELHQQARKENQKQVNDCFVCFERPINCVHIPCGHLVCCYTCGRMLKRKCPICNQEASVHKLYTT